MIRTLRPSVANWRPRFTTRLVLPTPPLPAVIALTRSLARALGPDGVRVNAVSPGLTETAMIAGYSDEQRANMLRRFPLGRFADPDEIANAGIYLISEKASFMTGEIMHVNGGSNFG